LFNDNNGRNAIQCVLKGDSNCAPSQAKQLDTLGSKSISPGTSLYSRDLSGYAEASDDVFELLITALHNGTTTDLPFGSGITVGSTMPSTEPIKQLEDPRGTPR